MFLYILFLYLLYLKNKHSASQSKRITQIIDAYPDIQNNSKFDNDTKSFIKYISENFMQSDLSINKVEKLCTIPAKEISKLLKKHFQLTFPKYVNAIRHTEAIRLLKTTDIKIVEIINLTDYGTVSHFNRVFKKTKGMTPSEYKKKIATE